MAVQPTDGDLDAVFAELVEQSWHYHHLVDNALRMDDLLVGALITVTLDAGHVLIDLTSDGSHHFLRFEDLADRARVTMALTHLTRDVTMAKAVGQRASLVVGYGEPMKSVARVMDAIRKETKSGYLASADPGIVTFDADSESQYLYAQIDLFLDIDAYVSDELEISYELLAGHVDATIHALRKFLRGRTED
jgi:hypothetical protein